MKVFVGGSKNIAVLSERVLRQIDAYRADGCDFLIGDCYGVDLCVQKYLKACGEENVTVYCSGAAPRNNVGNWTVVALNRTALNGYEFYRRKDVRMAQDADCGYMVWDGVSKGTKQNILELERQGKSVTVEKIS